MCRLSRVICVSIAKLNNRCFCHFMAAMLVPLGRVPTWRLYKFGWNTFSNKNHVEQGIGKVVYPSITYHISDSWLISLATILTFDSVKGQMSQWKQNVTLRGAAWLTKSRRIYVKINMELYLVWFWFWFCLLAFWPLLVWLIVVISFRLPSSVYININREEEAKETKPFHLDVPSVDFVSK